MRQIFNDSTINVPHTHTHIYMYIYTHIHTQAMLSISNVLT